jgi:hypothetical protein
LSSTNAYLFALVLAVVFTAPNIAHDLGILGSAHPRRLA